MNGPAYRAAIIQKLEPNASQDGSPPPEFDDERAKELLREDKRSMFCFACALTLATSFIAPWFGYHAYASPEFFDDIELLGWRILLVLVLFWPISIPCAVAALAVGAFLAVRLFDRNARRFSPVTCVALPATTYLVGYAYAAGTVAPNGY